MEQPSGYVAQGESSKVCFLRRATYRLKHSPRAWFADGELFLYMNTRVLSEPILLLLIYQFEELSIH